MALTKHPCKNHPEKFTSRKCYYCKAPICVECHHNYFHHLFCSLKCAVQWKILDILSVFKLSKEFTWFVVIVIVSNIIMYNLLSSRIGKPVEKRATTEIDSGSVYPATHEYLMDSIRYAVQGRFRIKVAVDKDLVLSMVHNGTFVESLLPQETEFSFDDVNLSEGSNRFSIWGINKNGRSVLIDSFHINYSAPRLDYLMRPIYSFRTDSKFVALTFDGGSSNRGTQEILDILKEKNVRCTMFLTGQFIQNFPENVSQIIEDGHEIGNHSFSHPHFTNLEIDGQNTSRTYVNRTYLQRQLNSTDSIFYALTSRPMKPYWRAPFGEINREILFWAAELGYRHIGWSSRSDSWDWVEDKNSELYRTADQIKEHFLKMEEDKGLNGKILLMHLGSERTDDFPYLMLSDFIDVLQQRGYSFKKISELLTK